MTLASHLDLTSPSILLRALPSSAPVWLNSLSIPSNSLLSSRSVSPISMDSCARGALEMSVACARSGSHGRTSQMVTYLFQPTHSVT